MYHTTINFCTLTTADTIQKSSLLCTVLFFYSILEITYIAAELYSWLEKNT